MIKNSQKEYCANNLASLVIERLRQLYPDIRFSKIVSDFMGSETYDLLYDFETGMWAEGPDYILEWYLKENENKNC